VTPIRLEQVQITRPR